MSTDPAAKQQLLVESIAAGVQTKLMPVLSEHGDQLKQLTQQLAKLHVTSNSIVARIETLESAVASGTGAKRAVRAGGAAKTAAKKPAGKKAGGDVDKVTNALLYCRYIMAYDIDEARATYGTDENVREVENDSLVSKRDKVKDPENYWSAVGAALWKTVLIDEQKEEIRTQFTAWKENLQREGADPQLEEAD